MKSFIFNANECFQPGGKAVRTTTGVEHDPLGDPERRSRMSKKCYDMQIWGLCDPNHDEDFIAMSDKLTKMRMGDGILPSTN